MSLKKLRVGQEELRWLARSLKSVEFFSALTMGEVEQVLQAISFYRYPADTIIIRQGDTDRALFILHTGRLVVSRARWKLFAKPIASLHPGDFFGEMSLIEKKPRNATVTTTEESEIFVLLADEFSFILEQSKSLATYIRQISAQRRFEIEQWERN